MAVRIKHGDLSSDQVASVTITPPSRKFEVMNVDGAAAIYFRFDGVDPEVEGDNCEVVPAAVGASLLCTATKSGNVQVRLISAGDGKFCVASR